MVELRSASVSRGGARLLDSVDFRLLPGARWAVLGPNGAGKTTFLRLLRGDIPPDTGGERTYDFPGQGGPQKTPLGLRQRLGLVSGDLQDAYAMHGWATTGMQAVLAGFFDAALLYGEPTPEQRAKAQACLAALGLADLADQRVAELSSGQARKILLARALACAPDVLVLDECLEGLDAPARQEFLAVLDRAVAVNPRLALLYASHRLDELPGCLTQALVLQSGRIAAQGPLGEILARLAPAGGAEAAAHSALPQPEAALRAPSADTPLPDGFLVRITDATVHMKGVEILRDISWTIRPGEHWAVLGPNGAGKSTLLALLAGEIWPSALAGPPGRVEHGFAAPNETLDDTRKRIGVVSGALQTTFPYDLRATEAVWTGLTSSLDLFSQPDATGKARAAELMEFFGLATLAGRRVRSLSRGQFRRVLLARAMVGNGTQNPALLLLDEPMAGLDTRARRATRQLLDRLAATGVPLVLVTHHERDLPEQVNRVLELEHGQVVFCGERAQYAKKQAARSEADRLNKSVVRGC